MSTLKALVSFDLSNGHFPTGELIADSAGNLYGTTAGGGPSDTGVVYEVVKTADGYDSTPIDIASFNGADGASPWGTLISDTAGNLFGVTYGGGANNDGTVFEIAKTADGYASTPLSLAQFAGANGAEPRGGLISDTAGNLYGTTSFGGANNNGTVFEIAKTAEGYGSTPTVLASFSGTDGTNPWGRLIADAVGNLFGVALGGGANNDGTVFEIAKSASGYASTPTTVASFNGANG